MRHSGLEPSRPVSVAPPPAADGFWDTAAGRDHEAWRYARRLAAAAADRQDRAARCAGCKAARAVEEEVASRPPPAPPRRLAVAARAVGRALQLVAAVAVGVACGLSAGGSGGLPLDLRSWGRLLMPTTPAAAASLPALPVTATPAAAAALRAPTIALPAARSAPGMLPVDATDWFATELVGGVTLAATMREVPAGALAQRVPSSPAPAPAAARYRVQLAMLRNQRYAEPVWVDFTTRLGSLTRGLEQYVLAVRTKRGLRHLVQTGPFADAGAARALCKRLRAAGGDCFVVPSPA